MVPGSSEYAAWVCGIRNTEILVFVGEGDACLGDSSSFGVYVVNHLGDGESHRSHLIREIQPVVDRARSVSDRMMRYVA